MEIVFVIGVAVGFLLGTLFAVTQTRQIKAENELLNQKLQRHNPRDAHGRFTRKK